MFKRITASDYSPQEYNKGQISGRICINHPFEAIVVNDLDGVSYIE
jgi:hypothetical protein